MDVMLFKLINGDPQALRDLFNLYRPDLVNHSFKVTQNYEDASAAVNDVFVSLWTNKEKLNPGTDIRAYLYTAVYNKSLQQIRNSSNYKLHFTYPEESPVIAEQPAIISNENMEELLQQIRKGLELCEPQTRRVVEMCLFDGRGDAEIAEILSIPESQVRVQRSKGYGILRTYLSQRPGGGNISSAILIALFQLLFK